MYNDNVMQVDFVPNASTLDVNSSVSGSVDVDASVGGCLTTEPRFYLLDTKKPYLINTSQVECVVGEWDKDKTQYGVRIFFASGNSVWCGGDSAREALEYLYDKRAVNKFNEVAKSHGSYNFGLG